MPPLLLRGSCACSLVTWTSSSPPLHLDFCHCTQCQRISGSSHIPWLGFPLSSFHVSGGDLLTCRLLISGGMDSIATRSCCAKCGGALLLQYDCYLGEGGKVHVAAGSVSEGEIKWEELPRTRIWIAEKAGWVLMPEGDGIERWEGFDEEFLGVLKRFEERERREKREVVGEVDVGGLEEESEDEVVLTRAREKDRERERAREEEEEEMLESDEELRELRRRYAGKKIRRVSEDLGSD